MSASLGELFVELVFEGDTKKAEQFKKKLLEVSKASDKSKTSIGSLVKGIKGYAIAVSGAIYAAKKLTDSLVQQNQTWLNLTRTTDVALFTYQKWNAVGKMFGVNNAAQQIKNLNDRLFELKLTGANAQGFILAGINPTNANDVMEQLRNRVSGLSDNAASYLLRQLGIDENMLHILRLSKKEFAELNNEVKRFQLTDEQRKQIQKMNVQLEIASQKLQYLKDRVILALLPYWVKFVKFIANAAEGLKYIAENLTPLEKNILKVVAAVGLLRGAIIALTAHPIIAGLSLLIGALMLLADDFRAYMTGGGSIIGVIMKAMQDFQKNGFFSDNVPKWIQLLATAADKLYKVYEKWEEATSNDTSGMHEALSIDTVPTDINELKKLRATVTDAKKKEALEYLIRTAEAKKSPFVLQANDEVARLTNKHLSNLNNNYSNNYTNNPNIKIENNIQTTETAKEVYDSFYPYLNFVNRNFAMQEM